VRRRHVLMAAAAVVSAAAFSRKRLRCFWFGHKRVRPYHGYAFRCDDCGKRAPDLSYFRLMESGYVSGRR
jgi:hypothetical protein